MKTAAGFGLVAVAGCLDEENTASSDESSTTSGNGQSSNCRIETKTNSQRVGEGSESVSAGADWVFSGDFEEGDVMIIEARKIGGEARPALEVEDPYGNVIANNDPAEQIHREIEINHDGRYVIRFHNEAIINSGMWDVTVDVESEYEEEVCT